MKTALFSPPFSVFLCTGCAEKLCMIEKIHPARYVRMKIMAIDYGDAHTGIAISDVTGTLAGFTTVIDSRKAEVVVQEILRLLPEHGVTELVLGYPKNMDGTVGPRAEKAAAFAETLRQAAGLPVTLWDERRTTVDAHNILFNNGKNAKKRKKVVDAVAASLMLEGYLTRKRLEAQRHE